MLGGETGSNTPIGKSLYEANATIDQPRFSPTGDKIAFIERIGQISQSSLSIVDLSGNRKILVEKWARIGGIAWMRSGSEILFSGYQSGSDQHLYCADMKGRVRLVLRTTSDLVPKDIDPQGKVLASRVSVSIGSFGLLHGDSQERDLSWFGMTHQFYLSEDGKTVVFYEERKPETAVYMRREGQPWPVRLGRGVCGWLSPDQKYALVCDPFEMVMRIVPTGPGGGHAAQGGHQRICGGRVVPGGKSRL